MKSDHRQNIEYKDDEDAYEEEYEEEYYDEYTDDDEEFEDEGVKWKYDSDGVGINKETGQAVFFTPAPQLELPAGIRFFLRIFGITAAIGVGLYISWYNGKLTLFGERYQPENKKKMSTVMREKAGDNVSEDYKKETQVTLDYLKDGDKSKLEEQDRLNKPDDISSLIQRI